MATYGSSILVTLVLLGALMLAWIALRLARRRLPGAVAPLILTHTDRVAPVVAMLLAISIWIGGYAASLLVSGSDATIWLHRISFLGVAATPPAILAIALDVTGRRWRSWAGIAAVSFVPVVTMGLALTSDHQHFLWTDAVVRQVGSLTPLDTSQGSWFWVHTTFSYGALAFAFGTLVREYVRAPRDYAGEAIVLGLAFLAPWAINAAYVISAFPIALDPTPVGMLITVVLFYRVLQRVHLADLLPVGWNGVIESIGDAILVVDSDGSVLEANRSARRLLEARDPTSEGFREELERLLRRGETHGEFTVGGDPPWRRSFDVQVSPVRVRMSTLHIRVVAVREVTERLEREAEKRALESRLHHAERLESLGVFVGGIAHDFNNLLTAILGSSELALRAVPDDHPARSSIELAIQGSQRAAELTQQLLAYSGKGQSVMQTLELTRCVRDLAPLAVAAISKKVRLRTLLPPDLPPFEGDPAQIQQVVMNLIINAAESYGDAPGVVTVSAGTVRIADEMDDAFVDARELVPGPHVYVEVRDQGCGMDASEQRRMFEPFFTTGATGRGLGLSAVLGITRNHAGAIALSSKPGEGTTVRVLFPASTSRYTPPPEPDESPHRATSGRILVVDDDPMVRLVATHALESFGYETVAAENGRAAIDSVASGDGPIDAVLLDMTLPDLNGIEVLGELRRLRPELPVVLSSGYFDAETGGIPSSDTTTFLAKPYTRSSLALAIEQALEPRPARGGTGRESVDRSEEPCP